MKVLGLLAATLVVSAVSAAPGWAQTGYDGSMNSGMVSTKMDMKGMDMYRARFIYNMLDTREVTRYRAMGFDDMTIKGAANLALHTGVDIEYFLGRIKIGGASLTHLASMFNISTTHLNEDLPGYGTNMMVMPAKSM